MSAIRSDQRTVLSNVSLKPLTLMNLKELTPESLYSRRNSSPQTTHTDQKIKDVATISITGISSTNSSPVFPNINDTTPTTRSASNSPLVSYISSPTESEKSITPPPEKNHRTTSAFSKVLAKSHSIYFSKKKDQDKKNI